MNATSAIDANYVESLLKTYRNELVELSPLIKKRFDDLIQAGWRATFSDFEGEVLYCLIRDRQPGVIYEISPDCGYSTIYITEAVKRNGKGRIYSFEIEEKKRGIPTEKAIRANILDPNADYYEVVLGDAVKTTPNCPDPDLMLIDSCHEAWFGEWYIDKLLPRLKDVAVIQDIIFYDRQEYGGEADVLLDWLEKEKKPYLSLGVLERRPSVLEARKDFIPRRNYETNSILYSAQGVESVPGTRKDIFRRHQLSRDEFVAQKAPILNHINPLPRRQNLHRAYMNLSRVSENKTDQCRFLNFALGAAISENQWQQRSKAMSELLLLTLRQGRLCSFVRFSIIAFLTAPTAPFRFIGLLFANIKAKLAG